MNCISPEKKDDMILTFFVFIWYIDGAISDKMTLFKEVNGQMAIIVNCGAI